MVEFYRTSDPGFRIKAFVPYKTILKTQFVVLASSSLQFLLKSFWHKLDYNARERDTFFCLKLCLIFEEEVMSKLLKIFSRKWKINLGHCHCQSVWPDWPIFWSLGNFSKPVATINLPKSHSFLGNFCKGVKIFHFASEIIFGQLL